MIARDLHIGVPRGGTGIWRWHQDLEVNGRPDGKVVDERTEPRGDKFFRKEPRLVGAPTISIPSL